MVSYIAAGLVIASMLGARGFAGVVLLNLPATLAHELSHWVVALVTGCRPSFPSVWPKRRPNGGLQLGEVSFQEKRHVAAWVALAPLGLSLIAGWGLLVRSSGGVFLEEVLLGTVFGFLAWGALPSGQDWSIAIRHPIGALTALLVYLFCGLLLLDYF
jgi:hypothetical protein